MVPDVALGAIGAALIGAMISLISLIVSKESKVSDFRQAWIDALRQEFSSYLANVSAVMDATNIQFESQSDQMLHMQPLFLKLNESYYLIAFRLNPSEILPKKIQRCMVSLSGLILLGSKSSMEETEKLKVEFINTANELLKKEWDRVKRGEIAFRVMKWVAIVGIGVLTTAAILIVAQRCSPPSRQDTALSVQKVRSSSEKRSRQLPGDPLGRAAQSRSDTSSSGKKHEPRKATSNQLEK